MTDNGGREPQMVHLRQKQSSRGLFSPEVVDLVLPPLKFGGYSGMLLWYVLAQPNWRQVGTAGVLAGVGGSIFKEANPIIWGAVSGFQWFTLGTSFWCKLMLWHDFQHALLNAINWHTFKSREVLFWKHGAVKRDSEILKRQWPAPYLVQQQAQLVAWFVSRD